MAPLHSVDSNGELWPIETSSRAIGRSVSFIKVGHPRPFGCWGASCWINLPTCWCRCSGCHRLQPRCCKRLSSLTREKPHQSSSAAVTWAIAPRNTFDPAHHHHLFSQTITSQLTKTCNSAWDRTGYAGQLRAGYRVGIDCPSREGCWRWSLASGSCSCHLLAHRLWCCLVANWASCCHWYWMYLNALKDWWYAINSSQYEIYQKFSTATL